MAKAIQPRFPKTDKRLLGVWKSDKRRTFAEWNWKTRTPPWKKARLKSFFGKAEITYTRNMVHSKLPHRNFEHARQYTILGLDETSVAEVEFGELQIKNRHKYWGEGLKIIKEHFSKPEIKHIHFDKDYFWILIGTGKHREFYQKIRGSK